MSATERRHLSCAETAKLVRQALKADFPGVKFSVRSHTYAGGASITAYWTDGPTAKDVERKTLSLYSGATFDGMVDLKEYHDSMLMGPNGPEVVSFGADFVFSSREISDVRRKVYRVEVKRFLAGLGVEYSESKMLPVSVGHYGNERGELAHSHNGDWAATIINAMAHSRAWRDERCPGGEGSYCPGCGRWQAGHEWEQHIR